MKRESHLFPRLYFSLTFEPISSSQVCTMKTLLLLLSVSVCSWIGWWLGARFGLMTGYLLSFIGSLAGVFVGVRIKREFMP